MSEETVDRNSLIIPALGGFYEKLAPLSYAVMRFAAGAVLVPHGVTKILHTDPVAFSANIAKAGFPEPVFLAYLAYFNESVAAACVAIGLFTRIAAAITFLHMLVILFFFLGFNAYFWTNRGVEFALLWTCVYLAIFFRGGGRYSVDHLLGKEF